MQKFQNFGLSVVSLRTLLKTARPEKTSVLYFIIKTLLKAFLIRSYIIKLNLNYAEMECVAKTPLSSRQFPY